MKVCIDCSQELSEVNFELRKDTGKRRSQCTPCYKAKKSIRRKVRYIETNEYDPQKRRVYYEDHKEHDKIRNAIYYINNKDEIDTRTLQYYYDNKSKCLADNVEYRKNNPEKIKLKDLRYRQLHKDQISHNQTVYRLANPEKIKATRHKHYSKEENRHRRRATANAYIKHRRKTDPVFVLKERFKNRTRRVFAKKLGKKAVESITALLGCTPEFFKGYFEARFTEDMTWDKVYSGEIEIDHIVPISAGDTEQQLVKLSHYTNLQPMWKSKNQEKSDNLPEGVDLPF